MILFCLASTHSARAAGPKKPAAKNGGATVPRRFVLSKLFIAAVYRPRQYMLHPIDRQGGVIGAGKA
jgi:hypothetical protein